MNGFLRPNVRRLGAECIQAARRTASAARPEASIPLARWRQRLAAQSRFQRLDGRQGELHAQTAQLTDLQLLFRSLYCFFRLLFCVIAERTAIATVCNVLSSLRVSCVLFCTVRLLFPAPFSFPIVFAFDSCSNRYLST